MRPPAFRLTRPRPAARAPAHAPPACRATSGTKKAIDVALDGDESSDYINFVLKDAATNTWYDSNGSNFQMALVSTLRSFASMDDAEMVRHAAPHPPPLAAPQFRHALNPPHCRVRLHRAF